MRCSRNNPDTMPPSLEGADEREFLRLFLEYWAGHTPPSGEYSMIRLGYEQETIEGLPARVPRRFRQQAT